MSEWLIEQPWKGCVGLVPTAGSNPALSVLRCATNGTAVRGRKMWYTYVLKMADGEYYVGSTNDLKRRMEEHARGRGVSTKWRLPVVL